MAEDQSGIQAIVQAVVEEFRKTELGEERRRRESLELRVNELAAENSRSRAAAEEAERSSSIRAELQRLGVSKVDLAYKVVKEDIERGADGSLKARSGEAMQEYLAKFVGENPELLPARLAGGSGASSGQRANLSPTSVDLDKIRPGMSSEEMDRVRQEIYRVAAQTLRGLT
ncbi:MAG: hypothetical protein ABI824_16520 [Acidobacteriota bacterium]